ncbi:MAG: ABC transporter substrate-binding protein [Pyrodictiaceae archaeon]
MVSRTTALGIIAIVTIAIIVAVVAYAIYGSTQAKEYTKTIPTTIVKTRTTTITKTLTKEIPITKTMTSIITTTRLKPMTIKVVVDALGNRLEFTSPPKRVVSLAPSITEELCSLGLCDKLVGVDQFSNYPEEVIEAVKKGRIVIVGGYWNPDVEKIVKLKPDLVLADAGVPNHAIIAKKLREEGIKVLFLLSSRSRSIDDIASDIMRIATVFGVEDKAMKLLDEIRTRIHAVSAELVSHNVTKPKTLVVFGSPKWGIYAAGGGTFIDYVIRVAGGVNVAAKYYGWPMLSSEDIVSMNPSVVIIAHASGKPKTILSAWMNTSLAETTAFKTGRVCVVTGPANDALLRPGPRIADSVEIVASILHPELFKVPASYKSYVYCMSGGSAGG